MVSGLKSLTADAVRSVSKKKERKKDSFFKSTRATGKEDRHSCLMY